MYEMIKLSSQILESCSAKNNNLEPWLRVSFQIKYVLLNSTFELLLTINFYKTITILTNSYV